MSGRIELLTRQLTEAFEHIGSRIDGLTEDEFLWEPVPGCWTVHLDAAGRWVADYEQPDPEPPPFTTIAWRLTHVATCKVMYHEYAFGARTMTWDTLEVPHNVAAAVEMLEEGQRLLEADLRSLGESDLDAARLTNWGELWPAWRIFWTMAQHDLAHGAEIGVLRDLYRQAVPSPASG